MKTDFIIYLQDHLLGASFAIELLKDMAVQELHIKTHDVATKLLDEVQSDCSMLERYLGALQPAGSSMTKKTLGWLGQRFASWKFDVTTLLGLYEAVEFLALGVLGKLALWKVLEKLQKPNSLDLSKLIRRAEQQHKTLEELRLELCVVAFMTNGSD